MFAGIVAGLPSIVIKMIAAVQAGAFSGAMAMVVLAIFLAVAAAIVFLEKGETKDTCPICTKNYWSKGIWRSKYLYSIQD